MGSKADNMRKYNRNLTIFTDFIEEGAKKMRRSRKPKDKQHTSQKKYPTMFHKTLNNTDGVTQSLLNSG
jgi:hypothetical protein